jgi:glycosyltransferase involved in cell wall biosynthesis
MDLHKPPLLVDGPEVDDTYDIAYLTRYVGKLDTGIAFTDRTYLDGLSRSAYSTLVIGNSIPAIYPADGLAYTTSVAEYRRRDPKLHIVNGLGSYVAHLRSGYLPEHRRGHKVAILHEEPAAFDFYATDVWNRRNVRDTLLAAHDAFVFVSQRSRDLWVDYAGLDEAAVHVLPNTCAEEAAIIERFAGRGRTEAATALNLDPHALNVVMVGTVQRLKAQLDAVEAIKRLRAERPHLRVRLQIVGRSREHAYSEELAATIAADGLDDVVTVVGEVPKLLALEHIAAADVLVLASHTEAMPLVLLEAMQLGTPVVTTAVGGVPEVLDERSAAFFDVADVDALAAHLAHVADDPLWAGGLAVAAADRYWAEFSNARFRTRFDATLRAMAVDAGLAAPPVRGSGATRDVEGEGRRSPGVLEVRAVASGRAWRTALAAQHTAEPLRRVEITSPGSGLEPMLALAAPLARLGLGIREIDSTRGVIVCAPDGERSALRSEQVLRIVGDPVHLAAYAAHVRADARRRARARTVASTSQPAAGALTIERGDQPDPAATAGAPASPLRRVRRRVRRSLRALRRAVGRRTRRSTVSQLPRGALASHRLEPGALAAATPHQQRPTVVMMFNSPMQLMAALSLWDHAPTLRDARLVALVHSTNGATGFAPRLAAMAERTGRFDAVADISAAYGNVYAERPSVASVRSFGASLRSAVGPGELHAIYVAAYMSARGQKFLYEVARGVPVRLFEDGIGSYVPKSIRLHDDGTVERVMSGDCAVAHHIGLVESVDLMLAAVPVPPQYAAGIERVSFPRLTVGAYRIDYTYFARVLCARRRAFDPDEVLLVGQNFADHLRPRDDVERVEQDANDSVVAALLDAGHRVVIRPHPRASAPVWTDRWDGEPRVTVWDDQPMMPVEVLLDPGAPPRLVVGATSSCLFYLHELTDVPVRRFPEEALAALRARANDEHAWMLDLSVAVLPAIETRTVLGR